MKQDIPQSEQQRIDAPPRALSEVLTQFAAEADSTVSIEMIRDRLGDRGFAALLIIFAAINMLPLPPGTSVVLGIPLVIVAAQMAFGRQQAWLPRFILSKTFSKERFASMCKRIVPHLERVERVVQPRYWPFSRRNTDRYIGVISFILAIAVVVPIPFGNWLPASAIALLGVALSERDGYFLSAGIAVGVFSLAIIGGVVGAAGAIALAVAG